MASWRRGRTAPSAPDSCGGSSNAQGGRPKLVRTEVGVVAALNVLEGLGMLPVYTLIRDTEAELLLNYEVRRDVGPGGAADDKEAQAKGAGHELGSLRLFLVAALVDTLVGMRLQEKDPGAFPACRALEKVQETLNKGALEVLGETFVWMELGQMFDAQGKEWKDKMVLKVVGSVEIEGQSGTTQTISVAEAVMQLLQVAYGREKAQGKAPSGDIERETQAKVSKKKR